jgi:hypothetical protein
MTLRGTVKLPKSRITQICLFVSEAIIVLRSVLFAYDTSISPQVKFFALPATLVALVALEKLLED